MEIMDEMAAQIRDVLDDVTTVKVEVEPRMNLTPNVPSIDIFPADSPRDFEVGAFSVNDDRGYFINVRARVSTVDQESGQDLLLSFIDPTSTLSIGQALYDDPSLNALASDLDIVAQTGYTIFPTLDGTGAYLGCQFTVRVFPVDS